MKRSTECAGSYYSLVAVIIFTIVSAVALLSVGCATIYQPAEPDSVAPDGKTYQHIYWPAGKDFWPISS